AAAIEDAEIDALCVRGEQREVAAATVPCRAERVWRPRPDPGAVPHHDVLGWADCRLQDKTGERRNGQTDRAGEPVRGRALDLDITRIAHVAASVELRIRIDQ